MKEMACSSPVSGFVGIVHMGVSYAAGNPDRNLSISSRGTFGWTCSKIVSNLEPGTFSEFVVIMEGVCFQGCLKI